jgi:hypothetical protein
MKDGYSRQCFSLNAEIEARNDTCARSESGLNPNMLGLQRPSGERTAEIGLGGAVEAAAINVRYFAGRDEQGQYL